MYSEWVSLQTAIQNDHSHSSVLKRFPATVGKEIVVPVVKSVAQGFNLNSNNDQPSKLHTTTEVDWTMEVICFGLTLPFTEVDVIKDCVNIYCEWLSGCLIKKKMCVPKPVIEAPTQYSVTILSHLYNLFVPREKSTLDHVSKQAMLCHRVLRKLEDICKESKLLSRELWESILKFLLAITDTLLAPPKEKDGISDELAERVISVLFEIWLISCASSFPSPSLWRTFREMCSNWRHHEAVITQWNRVNTALVSPLLCKLYGPDFPPITIGSADKKYIHDLERECVRRLADDCLVQCWFRFLHILSNPVDLCRVEIISDTPKFMHYALTSEKVIEPHQHECLRQLPKIFNKAMKGISQLMDAFLGKTYMKGLAPAGARGDISPMVLDAGISQPFKEDEAHVIIPFSRAASAAYGTSTTPPMSSKPIRSTSVVLSNSAAAKTLSPGKLSAASFNSTSAPPSAAVTPLPQTGSSAVLHYKSRPILSTDRSAINSILNTLGAWLFEAALCHITKTRRPGSVSHHTPNSMSTHSASDTADMIFDQGRAEACGAIARLMCSKKTGETLQPVYVAKCYMTIYHALNLAYPVKGEVMTFTLFHMADILRVDLPGVNILLPKILPALEMVLTVQGYNFAVHEHLPEVELRKASIHILLSMICLPLHYMKMEIKDLFTGEFMYTFESLRPRIARLILSALNVETDSNNCTMLLGAIAAFVQDYSMHEYREQENKSSDTSSLSLDHYNLTSANSVANDNQSVNGDQQKDQSDHRQSTSPEVILRKPKKSEDFDTAAGLLGLATKQICMSLIKTWWKDYTLALSALETLTLFARVKLQIINTAMCKDTVTQICRFICELCNKPPKNQTRDLHSMLIASFQCLSHWILEHPYLMQMKECLYSVLEVVELGISGKRSRPNTSGSAILKSEKDRMPMSVSMRVKDAAEALLMCITDQVDSFPCPCGSESLYSTISEKDLTEDVKLFKYFSLGNMAIVAILDQSPSNALSPNSAMTASPGLIKVVIRGPFGRQIWVMQPKSEKSGITTYSTAARPHTTQEAKEKPRIKQRWWPSSVDKIPNVKADKSIPGLDDLEDLDTDLAKFLSESIEQELRNGPKLAQPQSLHAPECRPPKAGHEVQPARLLLSQLGLLGPSSLQDPQVTSQPSYLSRLDNSTDEFYESLANLDSVPNRTRDTVFVFYVKSGQTKVSDILDNAKGYKNVSSDYKDFLLSLGWPVKVQTHPGWTGLPASSHPPSKQTSHDPDQIPSSCGPSVFDGTRWLLYWADSRSEVAFIVPTDERISMISKLSQDKRKHSTVRKISTTSVRRRSSTDLISLRRASLDVVMESQIAKLSSVVSSKAISDRKNSVTEPVEETSETESSSVDITGGRNSYKEAMLMADVENAVENVGIELAAVLDMNVQKEEQTSLTTPAHHVGRSLSRSGAKYYPKRKKPAIMITPAPPEALDHEDNVLADFQNVGSSKDERSEDKLGHAKPLPTVKSERFRRITYDLAMGVISPLEWSSMIEEHEKQTVSSGETSNNLRTKYESTTPNTTYHSAQDYMKSPTTQRTKKQYRIHRGFKKIISKMSDDRKSRRRQSITSDSDMDDYPETGISGFDANRSSGISEKDVVFSVNGDADINPEPPAVQITVAGKETKAKSSTEVRTLIVWYEKIEDKETIPWEKLLNITNGFDDNESPAEYMIIYITALDSGLLRVHVHCQTERCYTPVPLVDGMVCSKRSIGTLVRQTSLNMSARRRLLSDLSLVPHNKKVLKMQEVISKYKMEMTEAEFYESLFTK